MSDRVRGQADMSMIPGFVIDQQSQETLQAWKELGRARRKELLRGLRASDTSGDFEEKDIAQKYARTLLRYRARFITYEEILLLGLAGSVLFLVWLVGFFGATAVVIVVVVILALPAIGIFIWIQRFKPIADRSLGNPNQDGGAGSSE